MLLYFLHSIFSYFPSIYYSTNYSTTSFLVFFSFSTTLIFFLFSSIYFWYTLEGLPLLLILLQLQRLLLLVPLFSLPLSCRLFREMMMKEKKRKMLKWELREKRWIKLKRAGFTYTLMQLFHFLSRYTTFFQLSCLKVATLISNGCICMTWSTTFSYYMTTTPHHHITALYCDVLAQKRWLGRRFGLKKGRNMDAYMKNR